SGIRPLRAAIAARADPGREGRCGVRLPLPGWPAPGASLLALDRQPGPHPHVERVHRHEPHRHGDLLQDDPQGAPGHAATVGEPIRHRARADRAPRASGRPYLRAARELPRPVLQRGQEDRLEGRNLRALGDPEVQHVPSAGAAVGGAEGGFVGARASIRAGQGRGDGSPAGRLGRGAWKLSRGRAGRAEVDVGAEREAPVGEEGTRKLRGLKALGIHAWRGVDSRFRDVRFAALMVGLLAALVYANSLANGFAYDDVPIIVENESIQSLEALPRAVLSSYGTGLGGETASLWRPVTTAAFGLQHVLGGGSPIVFHAVNVLLHSLVTMGVLVLLVHLMPLAAAWLAAVVFAVHPVHVEAVANVVGFAELFSTAAVMGAMILHVRSPERSGWGVSLAIGLLYALAFGAKESAVTLPGLVFLVDAARGRLALPDLPRYLRERWRDYLVMLVVALGLLAARIPILGAIASPTGP